jgi:hypothetical protein
MYGLGQMLTTMRLAPQESIETLFARAMSVTGMTEAQLKLVTGAVAVQAAEAAKMAALRGVWMMTAARQAQAAAAGNNAGQFAARRVLYILGHPSGVAAIAATIGATTATGRLAPPPHDADVIAWAQRGDRNMWPSEASRLFRAAYRAQYAAQQRVTGGASVNGLGSYYDDY